MARLWTAGAELQSAATGMEFTSILTNAPTVETSTKRSGNAAWRISNAAAIEGFRIQHTASQGSFFFRFYLYIVAMPTLTRAIGGFRITGAEKVVIRLTSGGALQLYNFEDSAQVGSNSSALSLNTWYRIEIACDSTTLASTAVEAKLDGTSFANGTVDLAANPTSVYCGIDSGDVTLDYIVDDLALNDSSGSNQNSWPGEGEVIILRPSGAGDNTDWTRGGTDTGANWSQTSETTPDDATTYVQSNTVNQREEYNIDNTPAALESTDTINVVHVGVRAAVDNATGADPDIALRVTVPSLGATEESSNLDLNSVTWASPAPLPSGPPDIYRHTLYGVPLSPSTPWTKAYLDEAQIGMREAVSDTHFARVSAVWMMVDHKPGSAAVTKKFQRASVVGA